MGTGKADTGGIPQYARNRVLATAEIVKTLVAAYDSQGTVNIARLRATVSSKHALPSMPKLMEILAALPEGYRDKLAPFLRAKPVRSASGIAVVAVMCKPHRCPHIATTGGVCT
jgi:elongator complex protein 3